MRRSILLLVILGLCTTAVLNGCAQRQSGKVIRLSGEDRREMKANFEEISKRARAMSRIMGRNLGWPQGDPTQATIVFNQTGGGPDAGTDGGDGGDGGDDSDLSDSDLEGGWSDPDFFTQISLVNPDTGEIVGTYDYETGECRDE